MPAPLPLGIRNRLAELILEAFDAPDARVTLEALAAWCGAGQLTGEGAVRLGTLGWFAESGAAGMRLAGAHQPYRDALCRRAAAAAAAVAGAVRADAATLPGLLARAARLAEAGLYFELHELLEPRWFRAEGEERVALQGLIQIAVALHHAESGNRVGAVSLMADGLAKLEAAGSALPLLSGPWLAALARTLAAWREGADAWPALAWPAPTEAPWRSS